MYITRLYCRTLIYVCTNMALLFAVTLNASNAPVPFPQELFDQEIRQSCRLFKVNKTFFVCDATKRGARKKQHTISKNKAYWSYVGTLAAGNVLAFMGLGAFLYGRINSRNNLACLLTELGCSLGAVYLLGGKAPLHHAKYLKKEPWLERREAKNNKEQKILESAKQHIPAMSKDVLPEHTYAVQQWYKERHNQIRNKARNILRKYVQNDVREKSKKEHAALMIHMALETQRIRALEEQSQEIRRKQDERQRQIEEERRQHEEQHKAERLKLEAIVAQCEAENAERERKYNEEVQRNFLYKSDGRVYIPIQRVRKIIEKTGFFRDISKYIVEYLQNGYRLVRSKENYPGMGRIVALGYSPDGQKIAVTMHNDVTIILGARSLEPICKLPNPMHINEHTPDYLQWSPDNKQLIMAAKTGAIRAWDMDSQEELYTKRHDRYDNRDPRSLTYHPSSKFFACNSAEGVTVYDARNGNVLQRFKNTDDLAFSPSGETVALISNKGVIRIGSQKDIQDPDKFCTLNEVSENEKAPNPFLSRPKKHVVLYSPQGNQLMSYKRDSSNHTLKLWTLCTKDKIENALLQVTIFPVVPINLIAEYAHEPYQEYAKSSRIFSAIYAPDGKTILIVSYGQNKVIDAETLQELGTFETRNSSSLIIDGNGAYSPDSHETVTFNENDTILIGDGRGKLVQTLPGPFSKKFNITHIAYNPKHIGEFVSGDRLGNFKLYKRYGYVVDQLDDLYDPADTQAS